MKARIYEAVTTFNKVGYEQYGKRMLDSLSKHWPPEVNVRVYSEDVPGCIPMPAWLDAFKAKHGKNKDANGKGSHGRYVGQYNYRFDAVRFAHKTAAVIDSAEHSKADVLIWIDADTVTHSPVTMQFLRDLAPLTGDVISWLWRSKTYPECGFYMLNLRNPFTANLIEQWKLLYTTGNLFHLPEWHDSYVLKELVRSLKCPWHSLSGDASNTSHPFINGPLGAVMDHMKGTRKHAGISRARDLITPRDEAYWKNAK